MVPDGRRLVGPEAILGVVAGGVAQAGGEALEELGKGLLAPRLARQLLDELGDEAVPSRVGLEAQPRLLELGGAVAGAVRHEPAALGKVLDLAEGFVVTVPLEHAEDAFVGVDLDAVLTQNGLGNDERLGCSGCGALLGVEPPGEHDLGGVYAVAVPSLDRGAGRVGRNRLFRHQEGLERPGLAGC